VQFSGEILVTLKSVGTSTSTTRSFSKSRISHLCLSRCTCIFLVTKSYIQCLPWSFGRAGLEQNSPQVRITNEEGTLSRLNTNVFITRMMRYFYHSQKAELKNDHLNF